MSEAMVETWDEHEILEKLSEILVESFDVDPATIRPGAHVVDDLDLDSIDAIDLAVGLRERTGIDLSEAELKNLRLVEDIVELVRRKLPSP